MEPQETDSFYDDRLRTDGWHLDEVEDDDELDFALPPSESTSSFAMSSSLLMRAMRHHVASRMCSVHHHVVWRLRCSVPVRYTASTSSVRAQVGPCGAPAVLNPLRERSRYDVATIRQAAGDMMAAGVRTTADLSRSYSLSCCERRRHAVRCMACGCSHMLDVEAQRARGFFAGSDRDVEYNI